MQRVDRVAGDRVVRAGQVMRCAEGEIEVMLESLACGNCDGSCRLACATTVVVPAPVHRVGDRVLLSIDRRPVRQAVYRAFGLPLAGLVLGAAIADGGLSWHPAGTTAEGMIAAAAGIGLLAGLLGARWSLRDVDRYRVDVVRAPDMAAGELSATNN